MSAREQAERRGWHLVEQDKPADLYGGTRGPVSSHFEQAQSTQSCRRLTQDGARRPIRVFSLHF